jgi:hypothetical protein
MKRQFCLALMLWPLLTLSAAGLDNQATTRIDDRVKAYLPGDLVHIVAASPSNVVSVIAQTPDGQRLDLDFERRTHTWHGFWEVPYGFKKGQYRAVLIATDVEGKSYEGQTGIFFIGEPSLVTLIGFGTKETASRPPARAETAPEPRAEIEPVVPVAQAPAITARPAAKEKPKPKKRPIARQTKEQAIQLKVRLIKIVRTHLVAQEYSQAKTRLKELLRIDPGNTALKGIYYRLEEVIKAKEVTL